MTTRSTTQIATVRGYPEWAGFVSSPPKKYHTLTWSGTSEQQLWVGGVQIGGAKYEYSGDDHIDASGAVTSTHVKNYTNQCNGDARGYFSSVVCNFLDGTYKPHWFKGYFGMVVSDPGFTAGNPNFSATQKLCTSPSIPYQFVANVAINGNFDQSDLWGGKTVSGTANEGISDFIHASSTVATSTDSGTDIRLAMPYLPSVQITPPGGGPLDFYSPCQIIFANNYSALLSDEYTDAEALANARVIVGNGATAQTLSRTTGFVSSFTVVTFQLNCSNLIVNQAYVLSYDLWDQTSGVISTVSIPFVAAATTKTVSGSVPTPVNGHSVTVRNPRITFSS